jgi:hypothetical protein
MLKPTTETTPSHRRDKSAALGVERQHISRFREEEHSATASQIVPRYEKGWVGVDIEAEM